MNGTKEITVAEKTCSGVFATVFHAYMEASDEVQSVIRDMCAIVNDKTTDDDDRESAIMTLAEALFPTPHEDGDIGIDVQDLRNIAPEHVQKDFSEVDAENRAFADRLQSLMTEKKMTQQDLANRIGVQQPAISMMLNRKCRPQRRTIVKIAEALGVSPEELRP